MLTIRLLGGASLERDGETLTGPASQRHRLALLALLSVAHPRGVARDRLLGLLWPDRDTAHARNLLNQAVFSLRRALGDDAIGSAGDELRLVTVDIHCDVIAFEAALSGDPASAAALYGGPFLDGFFLPDRTEFTQWAEGVRERLRRDCCDALEAAAAGEASRGDLSAAAAWWQRLAAMEPFSARVTLGLMEALAEAGDRAAAIQQARRYALLLEHEFDAQPDAEVMALAERLRAASETSPAYEAPVSSEPAASERPRGTAAPAFAAAAVEQESPAPARPHGPRRPWAPWIAGIAPILFMALWTTKPPGPAFDPHRVVITPLENRTGDPEADPIGEMAADLMTLAVTNSGIGDVVPYSSAESARRQVHAARQDDSRVDPLRALGEETGAAVVVDGSYYRSGDSLLFHLSIVDVATPRTLRTLGPFTTPAEDPRAAIDQLHRAIVPALAAVLDPAMKSVASIANYPPTLEAWLDWHRGRDAYTASRFEEAKRYYMRAVERDSTYLLPRIQIAIAYHNLRDFARADSVSALLLPLRGRMAPYERSLFDLSLTWRRPDPRAQYEAARATARLAPNTLPHVQWGVEASRAMNRPRETIEILSGIDLSILEVRGWITYWLALTEAHHVLGDHRMELRTAERAQTDHGDRPRALWMKARAHAARGEMGDLDRMIAARLAQPDSARPSPGMLMRRIGDELHVHGYDAQPMYERAVDWFDGRAASLGGDESFRWQYALALARAGRLADAQSMSRELAGEDPGNPAYKGMLGVIAAQEGSTADAEKWSAELAALNPPYEKHVPFFWRTCIAAQLHRTDEAVELLGQSLAQSLDYFVPHAEPCFDPIRDDRGFREMLRPRG